MKFKKNNRIEITIQNTTEELNDELMKQTRES